MSIREVQLKAPKDLGLIELQSESELELSEKVKSIFSENEEIEKYFKVDESFDERFLISTLNGLAEKESGCNILKALKSALGNPPDNKKIVFNVKDTYKFNSDSAINSDNNRLIVDVSEYLLNSERYIFDEGRFVVKSFDSNADSETYFIAHEFAHVVSFLNSGITDYETWENVRKNRPIGWVEFFKETDEMFNVYKELLSMGYTPLEICDGFKFLFETTEEARNVLGLIRCTIDEKTEYIGEGKLYQESYGSGIVTYLDNLGKIRDLEKNILIQIQNKLNNSKLLPMLESNESRKALDALGVQFGGFNLVNVPRENSAIEAIKKTGAKFLGQGKRTDQNNYGDSHLLYSPWYGCLEYEVARLQDLKQNALIDEITKISGSIKKTIILIQADEKQPDNYTFIQFNPNKDENKILNEKPNLLNIKKQNPDTVFIYYNGVNHFQALVPQ